MSNRLIDIRQSLKSYNKNSQTDTFTKNKTSRGQRYYSRPFQAIQYRVPNTEGIGVLQQKVMGCWATVTTILSNWSHPYSQTVEAVLTTIGKQYLDLYNNDTGLSSAEKPQFLRDAGLEAEAPQNPSIEGWVAMLKKFGPLWVTTDEDPGAGFSIHARVLIALEGDGTPPGTRLTFIDPADAREHSETLEQFLRKYESEAATPGRPLRIQIVHLPPPGHSLSTGLDTGIHHAEPGCHIHSTEPDQNPVALSFGYASGLSTPPELTSLLRYLGSNGVPLDYTTFATVEAKYFDTLKQLLVFHNIVKPTDTLDKSNFTTAVKDFQSKKSLTPIDGIPGEDTLWELQQDYSDNKKYQIKKVAAVKFGSSYDFFRIREDVEQAYNAMFQEVSALGGMITSDGSFRELGASGSYSRSGTSMHKMGIAIDLSSWSSMVQYNWDNHPYYIVREGTNRWRVYAVATNGTEMTISAYKHNGGDTCANPNGKKGAGIGPVTVTKKLIDLTAIMQKHGFRGIGNRGDFPGCYQAAEWWHFNYERALTPYISQYGAELLTLNQYSLSDLKSRPNEWENRKKIYQRNWFG